MKLEGQRGEFLVEEKSGPLMNMFLLVKSEAWGLP